MTRVFSLLAAACLLATLAVAVTPTASALACRFTEPPVGGLVGRTYEFATNVGGAVCAETSSYYAYVCYALLGPDPVCFLR